MAKILLVEDDKELLKLFQTVLQNEGHRVFICKNGQEAIDVFSKEKVDLLISDVMMPGMDGFELIQNIRLSDTKIPILMVTALGSMVHKQAGFKVGTDDYMVKPIDVNELVWRTEALLRRSQIEKETIVQINNTQLNQDSLRVCFKEECIELPQKEFNLLFKLLSSPQKIFTRRQIFEDIWGEESDTDFHTLDVHISRLRAKFKDNDDFKIVTVRGLGYKAVHQHEE